MVLTNVANIYSSSIAYVNKESHIFNKNLLDKMQSPQWSKMLLRFHQHFGLSGQSEKDRKLYDKSLFPPQILDKREMLQQTKEGIKTKTFNTRSCW